MQHIFITMDNLPVERRVSLRKIRMEILPDRAYGTIGSVIPIPLYRPPPTSLYVLGGIAVTTGGILATITPWAWAIIAIGVIITSVGLLREFDGCEGLDKARLEARNHMARFVGWLDQLDGSYKSNIEDWPGWRDLDDDAAMDFARYVARMSRGHDEVRHAFHEQRRALEEYFGRCEKARLRRRRWFRSWYAKYSPDGWGYDVLHMVVMIGRALAEQNEREFPSPAYVDYYAAIKRGEL